MAILSFSFFIWQQNIAEAQNKKDEDNLFMIGSLEKDKRMTGFYSKSPQSIQNKNWCVFIGENGKVYKISLIERNIHTLTIDGKQIADNQIWKHNAEYKPFLERFWREAEIENESAEIDSRIKPFDRKIAALDKEMEKIDKREEQIEKGSSSFTDTPKTLDAERRKLAKMQQEYAKQIEELAKLQENLSNEQDSLKLEGEIDKVLLQICEDLKSLGVVKTSKNLSFKLSNTELIVNGNKVSPEVYQLLKDRYIVELNGEFGFLYHWKGDV